MQIVDVGYVIKAIKYGEHSAVVTIVSKENGKVVGFVKSAFSKKKANIFELGNYVEFEATARLEDNMPIIKAELLRPNAIYFISNQDKLEVLCKIANQLNKLLPEKQDIERLFYYLDSFFNFIDEDNWLVFYAYFEFYLLEFLGIGIDLTSCVATETTENLAYVSPKSARAVCLEAGEPYKDKMFLYPHFIVNGELNPTKEELDDCFNMCEYFLTSFNK
ncbi:MAG: DNA repair protein RecO [Alphaproteobacteria bacterium]